MNQFLIGAAWMASTLALGSLGAWIWAKFHVKHGGDDQDTIDALNRMDASAVIKFKELAERIGSLETKVNLMTAFRPKGEGK